MKPEGQQICPALSRSIKTSNRFSERSNLKCQGKEEKQAGGSLQQHTHMAGCKLSLTGEGQCRLLFAGSRPGLSECLNCLNNSEIFPGGPVDKNSYCNAGGTAWITW